MPRVDVVLNGRTYPVACGEGEEERVRAIAAYVDGKAAQIRSSAGHVSDAHLLALTCLLLGDELFEAGNVRPGRAGPHPEAEHEAELAEAIGALADHVEALVGQVRQG